MNTHYEPIQKEIKPISFLFHRAETTVSELHQFFPVARELFREAVANDLTITDPIHWHYFGFAGDVTKPFTLEISLPVAEVKNDYDGKFHFKRTESFNCISIIHDGNWLDIPASYEKIMKFVQQEGYKPMAVSREIYINSDFTNPAANVTEIQLGIKM